MLLFGWKLKFVELPQLEDFTSEIIYRIVDMTTSQDRAWLNSTNAYYLVVTKRPRKKGESTTMSSINTHQQTLLDFIPVTKPEHFRMPYHFKINIVDKDAFVKDTISDLEYLYYKTFKSCRGNFYYMVSLNDFSVFDKYQRDNPAVQRACGQYSLADLVKIRLFMYKLGFKNYEQFYRAVYYMPFLPRELDLETIEMVKYMPHVSTLEHALNVAGSKPVLMFFNQLLQESVKYRLVDFKVLMVDGTFFHANCENNVNKDTGKYNDPDAGYRRHNGKKFGAGYLADCASSHQGTYVLPVHFCVYPGHVNEAGIFAKTYTSIPAWIKRPCKILLGDKGKYSIDNCKLVHDDEIVPIIDAPPNIVKHHLVDTPRKHRFNTDFIPSAWIPELDRIYALRGLHEASFSQDSLVYPGKRLNGYTIDIATQHFAFLKSLDHLTMLTAYKTGRPDLAWSSTAFTAPAIHLSMNSWEQDAEASGYSLLDDYAKKNDEEA
nr:hypothetical protein [Candidatus Sigynarchaeota archaeon]